MSEETAEQAAGDDTESPQVDAASGEDTSADTAPAVDAPQDESAEAGSPVDTVPEPGDDTAPADEEHSSGADELVHVDTIGMPAPPKTLEGLRVLGVGLPDTAGERLRAAGVDELLDDVEETQDVDVALISTRLPRGELPGRAAQLRKSLSCPLIVLVHTSGEGLASRLVARGADGVLAEGNEEALAHVLASGVHDQSLVETYEKQLSRGSAGTVERGAADPTTGMLRAATFEQRLLEYGQSGETPRIGFGRVLRFEQTSSRLSPMARELIRRRIALDFVRIGRAEGVDLYTISPSDVAVISDELSPHEAEALGHRLARVVARYAPNGTTTLGFAFGHAGPEVSSELGTLRELAQRALASAALKGENAVVGAEALALGVSSTIELEVATRIIETIEKDDAVVEGHAERVATLVSEMAADLGYDGVRRTRVRLAGLLHDIGKITLPPEALRDPAELEGDLAWAYRGHPVRGANYVRPSGGEEVASAIRGQHEHVDGSGFPEGLTGDEIPIGARLTAVACRYDLLRHGRQAGEGLAENEALEALREDAGTMLDLELVELLINLLRSRASLEAAAQAA